MIFTKEASFPYPVLSELSESYIDNTFEIEVDLQENTNEYFFTLEIKLGSDFILANIKNENAKMIAIIRSGDSKFYNFSFENNTIVIPKNRISLNKRTAIQVIIKAEHQMKFNDNDDLINYYDKYKTHMTVAKNKLLGISNVIYYDGSIKKPFELFEKRVNNQLESDIQIELGSETIIIHYRNEDMQFPTIPNNKILNYPYLYLGLQKALMKMIEELSNGDGSLNIDELDLPENALHVKLFNLLIAKKITNIDYDNIDTVIYKISDRLLEQYTQMMKGMQENGN